MTAIKNIGTVIAGCGAIVVFGLLSWVSDEGGWP